MGTLNYFTTTLGQAASLCEPLGVKPCATITSFIDDQAARVPTRPAVGFVDPGNGHCHKARHVLYTFRDLKEKSIFAAQRLAPLLEDCLQQTVALLSPSTPEFLFTWLGLIRLGRPVLLVAPQCQPDAIRHLCKSCDAKVLIHDSAYFAEAESASGEEGKLLQIIPIPFSIPSADFGILADRNYPICVEKEDSIAYFFHTSGTSSGLPKPIPQSHHSAVGVLPRLIHDCDNATFTTTPLYHGGISDCLRSWTSDAPIWLFWARNRPITASNVSKCLDHIKTAEPTCPPVRYFSSVPYILQMMAQDAKGLAHLQHMAIVGVGGAALPNKVGDALVAQNVNLVSRYGSAECGFLLSSHRDYAVDKAWQYLRADVGCEAIAFEPHVPSTGADTHGLCELIVKPAWPHRATTNRPDGSFATADLMAPHPTLPHAWVYHARADAQLTLITGKKFDPSPVEDTLAASTPLLTDVIVFGVGRPFPGALLFPARDTSEALEVGGEVLGSMDESLLREVAPTLEQLNAKVAHHARIGRNMLVIVRPEEERPPKSSKGTLMRNRAYEMYRGYIDKAYSLFEGSGTLDAKPEDEDMTSFLQRKTRDIVGHADVPGDDEDLFAYGVDSVASVQLRYLVKQLLKPDTTVNLSMTIVEEMGTIAHICQYIERQRAGESAEAIDDKDDQVKLMYQLVEKYGNFAASSPAAESCVDDNTPEEQDDSPGEVVLMTGATGALGAHVLSQYRASPRVNKIYCLVRGASPTAAHERVNKALLAHYLPGLDDIDGDQTKAGHHGQNGQHQEDAQHSDSKCKVIVLQSKLSASDLGLPEVTYNELQRDVTTIVHLAWAVNFRLSLHSFEKDHIAGTAHLLSLALSSKRKASMAFCSSIASVMQYPVLPEALQSAGIPELASTDARHASPLGYGRSKWVAEALCSRAAEVSSNLGSNPRIAIFRVGQLSGDTAHGVWNASEAWPLMLASAKETGCLPRLAGVVLDWLPVDFAAAAMIEGVASMSAGLHVPNEGEETRKQHEARVYHLVNNKRVTTTWDKMLEWVKQESDMLGGCEILQPKEWLDQLERLEENGKRHPALSLLPIWRRAYGAGPPKRDSADRGRQHAGPDGRDFSIEEAMKVAPILNKGARSVSREYFIRLLSWILKEIG